MLVAILGGAFDPIHSGHSAIIEAIRQRRPPLHDAFSQVWLMPCLNHTFGKDMTPAAHRLAMCQIEAEACNWVQPPPPGKPSIKVPPGVIVGWAEFPDDRPKVIASSYQINRKMGGSTAVLARKLAVDFPNDKFAFVIGQDNADALDKWVEPEWLKANLRFIVIPRRSAPLCLAPDGKGGCIETGTTGIPPGAWYGKPPHEIMWVDMEGEVSSTQIREWLTCGNPMAVRHLRPGIIEYIRGNELYPLDYNKWIKAGRPSSTAAPKGARLVTQRSGDIGLLDDNRP